jgi:hypothetical protein
VIAVSKTEEELQRDAFRLRCSQVVLWSDAEQFSFSIALAFHWKAFLASQRSPSTFSSLPRPKQMEYFRKLLAECEKYAAERDVEMLFPLEMLVMYLAAIIEGDREFEREAAAFLDAYTRRGWAAAKPPID